MRNPFKQYDPFQPFSDDSITPWTPASEIAGILPQLWCKADALALSNNDPVSTWDRSSVAGNDPSQADNAKKPVYKTNVQNGLPGVLFDTFNDCLTATLTLSGTAELTVFIVGTATSGGDRVIAEYGTTYSAAGGFLMLRSSTADKVVFVSADSAVAYGSYIENQAVGATAALVTAAINRAGTVDSYVRVNGAGDGVYNPTGGGATGNFGDHTLNLGSRNNGTSLPLGGYLFEILIYGAELSLENIIKVESYLDEKWGLSLNVNSYADNSYYATVARAGGGTFVKTSPGARLIYRTDATSVDIDTYVDQYTSFPTLCDMGVRVNGVDFASLEPSANGTHVYTVDLGAGQNKLVELIAGIQTGAVPRAGSYIAGAIFDDVASLVLPTTAPRVVVYGDSITVGANADNPSLGGWCQLVRNGYAGSLVVEARGSRSLYEDCVDEVARGRFANWIAVLNPSIIWLAIGTNDYGLNKWTAANFGIAYADVLEKLHAAVPGMAIYSQTPIERATETANALGDDLPAYRTAIGTAASGKSYVTLVDGTSVDFPQSPGDLADGIHPTTAGHIKYAGAVNVRLGL